MTMFKLPYLYYYAAAWLLLTCLQRVQSRSGDMKRIYPSIVFGVCTISLVVFLILGFWFMPRWWYPIAFVGVSVVAALIPIPDRIGAIISLVAAPVLCVLSYLSMFNVI